MTKTAEMKTWYGMIATVGTLGSYSRMPGTLGSMAACAVLLVLRDVPVWLILLTAVIGTYASEKYAKASGRTDPAEVIIDEVVGYWIACWGFDLSYAIAGLFLFRIVDITKPFPIRRIEKLPGGFGIMADDIVGGIMVNLIMRAVYWMFFQDGLSMIYGFFGR
ncbi:phosphatidylglycerophosphatase A [Synergistaceae bacterium OttesenSCG-928-D05]|nr:phosphatidylglycerophosphatase A [Synergistaceae bacterium OttesenSCG-928-D05]